MATTRTTARFGRAARLTAYRAATFILTLAIVAGVGVLVGRPAQPTTVTYSVTGVSNVERVASMLVNVGFGNPVYLGVRPAVEGSYPTFKATAIGGEQVNLWIRTTPLGGWEIQPEGVFINVASADDFARLANKAVQDWEDVAKQGIIKPSTDGSVGEYEIRELNYKLLGKYNPPKSYWYTSVNETAGWPR